MLFLGKDENKIELLNLSDIKGRLQIKVDSPGTGHKYYFLTRKERLHQNFQKDEIFLESNQVKVIVFL